MHPLFFLGGGILALVVSALGFWRKRARHRRFARATGVVTELIRYPGGRTGAVYSPKVSFHTATGERVEFESPFKSNPPMTRVGKKIAVLYDPSNPMDAMVDSFLYLYLVENALLVVGLLLVSGYVYLRLVI